MPNVVHILRVKNSIKHILLTLKSECRTLVTITWFPFLLLFLLLNLVIHIPFNIETHQYIDLALTSIKALMSAITIVGIYRYLLFDSRFRMHSTPLKRNPYTKKPFITVKLYFYIDKPAIILAIFLMIWETIRTHISSTIIHYILNDSLPHWNTPLFNITLSLYDMLPVYLWKFIYFSIGTQLCLIYPYISTSHSIRLSKIYDNATIALNKNRINVWIIQTIIIVCSIIANTLINLLFSYETYSTIYYVNGFLRALVLFITLIASAIFYSAIFKTIGINDGNNQQ